MLIMDETMPKKTPENELPTLFIGIDWADQKHDCHLIHQDGRQRHMTLMQSPGAIEQWIGEMIELAAGGKVAIILEQSKGALIHALMSHAGIILYPINPKKLARYRESFAGGEGKDDPTDAMYLARMLRERIDLLKPWLPNDEQTRLLNNLCQLRRNAVNDQNKLRQKLINTLKLYYPGILQLFGKIHQAPILIEMLQRWSDPRKLVRADRQVVRKVLAEHGIRNSDQQEELIQEIRAMKLLTKDNALIQPYAMIVKLLAKQIKLSIQTIKAFETSIDDVFKKHPDYELFSNLRGAGPALAPRLLTAFGSDRERWDHADQIASYAGEAPVTRQSGKQKSVHRRYSCPQYLRQTFHEFANSARQWCTWSNARYRLLKSKGMKHHAILRKLARSWIRILYRVWKTKVPFDSERYIQNLKRRSPEIIPFLENN